MSQYSNNDVIMLKQRYISYCVWNIHSHHVTAVYQWFLYNLAGGKIYTTFYQVYVSLWNTWMLDHEFLYALDLYVQLHLEWMNWRL